MVIFSPHTSGCRITETAQYALLPYIGTPSPFSFANSRSVSCTSGFPS